MHVLSPARSLDTQGCYVHDCMLLQESGLKPKSRNRAQVTKKVNCPAEIYITHIMKFPQHKVNSPFILSLDVKVMNMIK